MMRRLLAAVAVLPLCAQAQQFSFKDWAVACDNVRHCEAVGYQPEDAEQPVALWLARDAGGHAPLRARLRAEAESDDTGPYSIRVGKLVVKDVLYDADLPPAQVAQLLPALKDADQAVVTDARHQWTLSLAGLKAALLKMDDVQGRVGTVTALSRAGTRPATAVPPPPAVPVLRAVAVAPTRKDDDKLLPALLKATKAQGCDDTMFGGEADNALHRLSATEMLLIRECGRGAYQSSYSLWRINDRPPFKPVAIALPTASGARDEMPIGVSFDNGVLNAFAKGRGIADCGDSATWLWTGQGFQLLEAASGPMCRGLSGGGVMLRTWIAQKAN